jgi:glycosyltransferase involved in cell wall biosynthesis
VVALLATYNEERFVAGCPEHLLQQQIDVYLIDNCSTGQTVAIVSRYIGHGLIGIETIPRRGTYSWLPILERKEQLANTLDFDWFMNIDADEIRLPPRPGGIWVRLMTVGLANGVGYLEFFDILTK